MTRISFWAGLGLLCTAGIATAQTAIASAPTVRNDASPAVSAPNADGSKDGSLLQAGPGIDSIKPQTLTCDVIPDAIIPLRTPTFTGIVEWKKTLGIEGIDRISDMMPLADGGVVAVGESAQYTKTDGIKPAQLYIVRLAVTGKPVYEKRIPVKDFINVAGGIVLKDKIIVLSQLKDAKGKISTQIDLLDGLGAVKATYKIDDPARDVIPGDIISNGDGTSMTVAAMIADVKDKKSAYTTLFRVGTDGKILSRREFLPGLPTRVEQLQRLSNGNLVAAGRIRTEDDRDAGWILIVNRQGDLVMQRPYARGTQAQLIKIIDDGMSGMYALGEAIPTNGSYRAAWVMRLGSDGGIKWQRFLTGKYKYAAADLTLQKDGRLMVLMAGRPGADGGREHARIVTLASSGDILHDEAYVEGSNAIPTRLIEHTVTKQRILAGYAQTGFDDYGVPEDQRLITYDAWFAALTKLPTYTDPCKPAVKETLDDEQ